MKINVYFFFLIKIFFKISTEQSDLFVTFLQHQGIARRGGLQLKGALPGQTCTGHTGDTYPVSPQLRGSTQGVLQAGPVLPGYRPKGGGGPLCLATLQLKGSKERHLKISSSIQNQKIFIIMLQHQRSDITKDLISFSYQSWGSNPRSYCQDSDALTIRPPVDIFSQ